MIKKFVRAQLSKYEKNENDLKYKQKRINLIPQINDKTYSPNVKYVKVKAWSSLNLPLNH